MSQHKYKFGYIGQSESQMYTPRRQPTEVTPKLATTSTEESGRLQTGVMQNTPMFTAISYTLSFGKVTGEDLAGILSVIVGKSSFAFHHFNIVTNQWETSAFYASNIECSQVYIKDGKETVDSLKFQVTRINPI